MWGWQSAAVAEVRPHDSNHRRTMLFGSSLALMNRRGLANHRGLGECAALLLAHSTGVAKIPKATHSGPRERAGAVGRIEKQNRRGDAWWFGCGNYRRSRNGRETNERSLCKMNLDIRGDRSSSRDRKGAVELTYAEMPGLCKSATLEDISQHGCILTPGRYVRAAQQQDDGEPFEEKMKRLVAQLREQQAETGRLDQAIRKNLKDVGYDA